LKFKHETQFTPVLEATHRETVHLIVRITVDSGIARIQVPSPGIATRLGRRPKVGVRTTIVEIAVVVPVAGKQGLC